MKKVLLGMSGGVDSSVSAILLQKQGYEVIGITMALSKETDDADAKKVCQELGIEHHFVDMKNEFKKHVIDNFIDCYANAKTPNPCIECNRKLKFGVMFEKAKELGCDYLATGHYANIEYSDKYNQYVLKKGDAIGKDQSYVLYTLPSDMLENVIFPLGKFKTKDEIRKIAKENNLNVVANKPDSEEFRPVNFLAYNLLKFYKNDKYEILDIGTSTVNSAANFGLCDFKESIGCTCSPKLNFALNLQ